MEWLFTMFSKNTNITLIQILWNSWKARNTTVIQHSNTIIIDMSISISPQETRWQSRFFMLRVVCNILSSCRCPFQLQQALIFPYSHDLFVVIGCSYLNFPIKYVDGMALLLNVHKRQQVSLKLWKVENILQDQIKNYRQFKLDGANSFRFEDGLICKGHSTIYIVIKIFKNIFYKCQVASSTSVKQPSIYPRWTFKYWTKLHLYQHYNENKNKMSIFKSFTSFMSFMYFFFVIFPVIFSHGIFHVFVSCPFLPQQTHWRLGLSPWLCLTTLPLKVFIPSLLYTWVAPLRPSADTPHVGTQKDTYG